MIAGPGREANASVRLQRALKRSFDVVLAALLLLLLLPLGTLVALGVRATSAGGIIYRQRRIGAHGRPFTVYKFRTMVAGSADAPGRTHVPADDPRITRLGRLLRRTSLDELPQLINVLRGDMSFVGPRPDLPHHVERYTELQRRRLQVRPGITGWAQVHGRNLLSWEERIQLDVAYLEGWSLRRDFAVLLRTAAVVLSGAGAAPPPTSKDTSESG